MGTAQSDMTQGGAAPLETRAPRDTQQQEEQLGSQLSRLRLTASDEEREMMSVDTDGSHSEDIASLQSIHSSDIDEEEDINSKDLGQGDKGEDDGDTDGDGDGHDGDDDESRGSFQVITYESDDFSDWSSAGSAPTSPTLRSRSVTRDASLSPSASPVSLTALLHPLALPKEPATTTTTTTTTTLPANFIRSTIHKHHDNELNVGQEMRIPLVVWRQICTYLYPSQLARLSLVNKAAFKLVTELQEWTRWYNNRLHGAPKNPIKRISGLNAASHSYMLYLCSISFQVCEQCFRQCHDKKAGLPKLASMPLSVVMGMSGSYNTREPSQRLGEQMGPGLNVNVEEEAYIEHRPWSIRLCRPCRTHHFALHPEPIPTSVPVTSYLKKVELIKKYHIGRRQVQKITDRVWGAPSAGMPVLYSEQAALRRAREMQGGDVGVKAFGGSMGKQMEKMRHRCMIYHRRQQILESGGEWVPYEVYLLRKAQAADGAVKEEATAV
ncbi:hypothetical protein EDD11_001956 [Mortierella claussenii]|nr:hypothetical protein EDD11_001956 [Mortierella claussenii]